MPSASADSGLLRPGSGWVDSHCHLDHGEDAAARLSRAASRGVSDVVVAGVDPAGWRRQAMLTRHPGVHVAYGLHPWAVAARNAVDVRSALDALEAVLSGGGPAPVALGETGLDRSPRVESETLALQEMAFRAQLALARDHELPVILHVVRHHGRALEILASEGLPEAGGVLHGFVGSYEVACGYLGLGLEIGLGRTILPGGSPRMCEVARKLPLGRLLVETDAPDQLPEVASLADVLSGLATLRGETIEDVGRVTAANARRLFFRMNYQSTGLVVAPHQLPPIE